MLTAIDVTPANASIASGLSQALHATGVYSDNSIHDITSAVVWSSSNPAVAAISSQGFARVATALTPGSTRIIATMGLVSGSAPMTVTAASLVSIGVTAANLTLPKGLSEGFKATGVYTDNSTHDLTDVVAWSSSSSAVATISNAAGSAGLGTAVAPGSATISATLSGISGSAGLKVTAAALVSINLTSTSSTIAMGLQSQFTATGTYTDNTTQNITDSVNWNSSNGAIASVSNAMGFEGLSTGLSPGSVKVTATSGFLSGSANLTVTPATLVSIAVTPPNPSIANGLSCQFTATGTYTDNSTQNLTSTVAWSSTNTGVASISNAAGSNGLATALGTGSTTISAASGAISGAASLTVTPATLVSIAVTPPNPSIANGLSSQFTATGTYTDNSTQNLTSTVAWSSTNTGVASISNAAGSNGLATSARTGSTTISAASGAISGSASLTVTPATLVSIAVTPPNPSIANGLSSQFTATGTYTDNSTQNLTTSVTWSSTNTAVAAISNAAGSNGLATSAGTGSTTISAASGAISGSATLTVTPATLVSIAVTPPNPSIANGLSSQFTATGTYTDNSTQNLTTSVTWSSTNTAVASISNAVGSNGLATSAGTGSTTISAASGAISGSATLTVTPATLVSIAVTPPNPSIANGLSSQFVAIGTYTTPTTQNLTTSATWSSTNTGVASISNAAGSNGLATSAGTGSTTISAASGAISGSASLTVTPATLVSIAVTPATASVLKGASQQFTATGTFTDASTQNLTTAVTWSSSDTTIASVSNAAGSNGLAAGLGVGTANIGAMLGGISSPSAALTVSADPEYTYVSNQNDNTVSQFSIGADGTLSLVATVAAGNVPTPSSSTPPAATSTSRTGTTARSPSTRSAAAVRCRPSAPSRPARNPPRSPSIRPASTCTWPTWAAPMYRNSQSARAVY